MRLSLAVLSILAGCTSPQYAALLEEHADEASATDATSGDVESTTTGDTSSANTDSTGTESAGVTEADTATTSDDAADTGDATGASDSPPVGEADKPVIVSVELPAKVYAAGPVPLSVQTERTASVHVMLDGVDAGELIPAGDGLFTGALPVHGAIDNGSHTVEIVARQGKHEDRRLAMYEVSTPDPGTEAWSKAGPEGSRTNRVALSPAGDLLEGGQTMIDGVPRPTLRKRSGLTGAELWPEETLVLDPREGAVVDLAVLPDGRMWVAMNVKPTNKDQRPRIALLDADGQALGVEMEGAPGRVVRGIAADADGGCFAVGLAPVMGDWDIAFWRINAAGVQTLTNTFDYVPDPNMHEAHSFVDLASDVVIAGDIAWIVGMSKGLHDKKLGDLNSYLRGILVPRNIHTGNLAGKVIAAPLNPGGWRQSAFFGAALHPEGVVVTGHGCDATCSEYRIEASRYNVVGERTWFESDLDSSGLAYGSDVALDGQGRVIVAGAVTQDGKLRGYMFARKLVEGGPRLFEHWYPGVGPSEALGVVLDSFDRSFPAGYITVNGESQAWLTLIQG